MNRTLTVNVQKGNPIITGESEADREKYNEVLKAADERKVVRSVTFNVSSLTIETDYVKRTTQYPKTANIAWVLRRITAVSKVISNQNSIFEGTCRRFLKLCNDVIEKGGTCSMDDENIYINWKKEDGTEFNAKAGLVTIMQPYRDQVEALIKKQEEKEAYEDENARLMRLAKKHGVI